ncbi:hypothetical protein DFH28DRAFT_1158132 [Melampsora americana]|nr:hypothetical protein DFH28DRAFT_1158132 [Melampsora americana]
MQSSHIRRHKNSANHQKNVKPWMAKQEANERNQITTSFINHDLSHIQSPESDGNQLQAEITDTNSHHNNPEPSFLQERLIDLWTKDHSQMFRTRAASVNSSQDDPIGNFLDRRDESESSDQGGSEHSEAQREHEEDSNQEKDSWYPFANLEQMVGFLVLGSTRTTMSKLQYDRVSSFIALLEVKLPAYKTLQKELANPYVTDHLEFMPSLPNEGSRVSGLAQSKKWREGLDPDLRVQMVDQDNGHFYLHEPVQLTSQRIVIPCYFYKAGNEVLAKCVYAHLKWENPSIRIEFQHVSNFNSELFTTINVNLFWREFDKIEMHNGRPMKDLCGNIMYAKDGGTLTEAPTINSWRKKANGRIIRNVPLVLYCDDLSGNKSKRWNKHIAFYFTLAGLPPKLSNQEYNCHFVTTSNTAAALELADPLVDDLNELMTNGFAAYDHKTKSEVLVMTSVLCHLGDSPMHAEVTNTMNPTSSLSPCRVCHLKVNSLMEKRSTKYVCNFVGIDEDGNNASLPNREWSETISATKQLWDLAQKPGTIGQFDMKSSALGVKDALNMSFVKMVQDLHRDSSVSVGQTSKFCDELNEQFGDRLFNPFLRLKVLNAPPNEFVFCKGEKRRMGPVEVIQYLWVKHPTYPAKNYDSALSQSQRDLDRHAFLERKTLNAIMETPESLQSIPTISALAATLQIYDHKLQTYIQAGPKVHQAFRNNRLFQKALGFNSLWNQENSIEIGSSSSSQPFNANEMIPNSIRDAFTANDWRILNSLTLKSKQKVESDVFVSFKNTDTRTGKQIARVLKIWGVGGCSLQQIKVEANICRLGQVNGFYGMRELAETNSVIWISPADIEGILNVQHNCHSSKCQIDKIRPFVVERRVSKKMDHAVVHETTNDYIINSGAFYSCELHRFWANIPFNVVSPDEWIVAVKIGIANWQEALKKKDNDKEKQMQKAKNKSVASQASKKRRTDHYQLESQVHDADVEGPVAGPSTW